MLPLAQLIAQCCSAGERVALCTLVKARGSTPQEMAAMVASELQKWTRVVADAKIPRL